jgi:hypothetical protein
MALATMLGALASGADSPADGREIERYDPISGELVPVPEGETRVGSVYKHFSGRLNRRVWGIRQANGQFSHALGEGTTQSAPSLDIRHTLAEKTRKLEQVNRDLLMQLEREGGTVFFKLTRDDKWQLASGANHPTIYDIETNRRWELVNGLYLPVSSAPFAYQWRAVDGDYVPLDEQPSFGIPMSLSDIPTRMVPARNCGCAK